MMKSVRINQILRMVINGVDFSNIIQGPVGLTRPNKPTESRLYEPAEIHMQCSLDDIDFVAAMLNQGELDVHLILITGESINYVMRLIDKGMIAPDIRAFRLVGLYPEL